jgi:hypothetical protein
MESVPPDRLVRLLNILEKNIRDGTRVSPIADPVSIIITVLYHIKWLAVHFCVNNMRIYNI